MPDQEWYLGVDGGGTKTTAVLADSSGNVVRSIKAGACNVAVLKPSAIAEVIDFLLTGLLGSTPPSTILRAAFAFAGAGRPKEKASAEQVIRDAGVTNFDILTDAEILYYSIFAEKPGILIAAGTGSICLIRTTSGAFKQIGGRGYLLGDEGSGFDIGNRAIRRAIHDSEDGKVISPLTAALLSFYELQQPEDLVSIIYTSNNPPNVVAGCAHTVCNLAESGEPDALMIVNEAAQALVDLVRHAMEHLPDQEPYSVALAGSILSVDGIVTRLMQKKLEEGEGTVRFYREGMPPAAAALLYAVRRQKGIASEKLVEQMTSIRFQA